MRTNWLSLSSFALALSISGTAAHGQQAAPPAKTPAPAQAAPASGAAPAAATGTIRGRIADQTSAVIPGAVVTIDNPAGATVKTATADATGSYSVNGLAAGSYVVLASYQGFAPFASGAIQLAPGQSKRVDITMAVEVAQQQVVVTEDAPTVSTDAGSNASAIVLKGKDLDALSDDPDELSNELTALAGPSAGPNGGQIYIDGFTGGTLPPKSAIREIRINQNPFSAEFDKIGYGRIEILTKPGTDVLHGRAFVQGNDSSFNTDNPFVAPPSYHSVQYNGTLGGSLGKKASFFLSVEGRNSPDASIYSVETPVLLANGTYAIPTAPTTGALQSTANRIEVSPRLDLQLGAKNTLTLRYQYEYGTSSGGIGSSTSLPTQSSASTTSEHSVQVLDSQIINDRIVNETRIQYRLAPTVTTPVSLTPQISVPGYFIGGGASAQYSSDRSTHMELQNITTMSAGAQAIKFGTWLRDNRDANTSLSGFNGSFSFNSIQAYVDTLNGLAAGQTIAQIAAACPAAGDCTPSKLTYSSVGGSGKDSFVGNVFDAAVFFQDDWKVNQFLTLSGGLRWEGQNHIADHSDWAPRAAFAYALDGHKKGKTAKTILRGGFGLFYDRFAITSLIGLERYGVGPGGAIAPTSEVQTVVTDPTCFSSSSLAGALNMPGSNCSPANPPQAQQLDPTYHSPYNEQVGTSLERQLTKTTTLTFTYLHTTGQHQLATRDSNAYEPLPGTTFYNSTTGPRPDPALGPVDEIYPEAVFKQNQMIVNVNARLKPTLSILGFYTANFADGDTGTASNSYNLKQDYGRAAFVRRNMVFMMGNYTGPLGITFNPFLIAQSGRPFNVTTLEDLTGDNFFNDRPAYADTSACQDSDGEFVTTSLGCLDITPAPGAKLLAPNLGNSPASVAFNLRVSRSFGIGPKLQSQNPAGAQRPGGPGGPGGFGGGFGGPGGGGGGRGGGGGGGYGPTANTGHKYSLTFSAQALNLFNDINYGTPSGSVSSVPIASSPGVFGPGNRFDKSTSLAGGIFASPSGSASRRIFFQAAFNF